MGQVTTVNPYRKWYVLALGIPCIGCSWGALYAAIVLHDQVWAPILLGLTCVLAVFIMFDKKFFPDHVLVDIEVEGLQYPSAFMWGDQVDMEKLKERINEACEIIDKATQNNRRPMIDFPVWGCYFPQPDPDYDTESLRRHWGAINMMGAPMIATSLKSTYISLIPNPDNQQQGTGETPVEHE